MCIRDRVSTQSTWGKFLNTTRMPKQITEPAKEAATESLVKSDDKAKNDTKSVLKEAMRVEVESNFKTYFVILFFTGLITSSGFTLILSSAKDVAASFKMSHIMGMFQLVSILAGITMKTLNSKYLLKIEHRIRFKMVLCFNIIGYSILICSARISESWGFFVALVGAISIGLGSCLGDAVIQGFLSTLPSIVVAGWASGLGIAGAYSSTFYLSMKYFQVPLHTIYSLMLPLVFMYWNLFKILDEKRNKIIKKISPSGKLDLAQTSTNKNTNLSWVSFKQAFPHIKYYLLFSFLVYWNQYTSMGCFSQKYKVIDAQSGKFEETFLDKQGFVFLTLSYQIATFLSRSSIRFYKFPRVHLLVIAQVINGLLLFTISILRVQFAVPVPIIFNFALMFWTGLVGGGYFVNAMFQIMGQQNIPADLKELCVNLCSITNDVGIFCAALTTIFFDNTILKYSV
eukprot:TRINITY_DN4216_c0_g1_i13.p1 TRINITY_DN4216_c0_g1~~TRINITY_DN4216_c0_g1_i13.p1  ORF type:complete len:485 (+),score=80.60 TRINITY_DN4216_c0_g1_i13:90-1457(+)